MSADERVWELPTARLPEISTVPMKIAEGMRPLGKVTLPLDSLDEQVEVGDRVWLQAADYSASVVGVVHRIVVEIRLDDDTAKAFEPIREDA